MVNYNDMPYEQPPLPDENHIEAIQEASRIAIDAYVAESLPELAGQITAATAYEAEVLSVGEDLKKDEEIDTPTADQAQSFLHFEDRYGVLNAKRRALRQKLSEAKTAEERNEILKPYLTRPSQDD